MDNRPSNNIQSQDGNSTIISKNWKKRLLQIFCLYKKTSSGQLTKWLEPLQYVHATKVRRFTTTSKIEERAVTRHYSEKNNCITRKSRNNSSR